MVSLKAIQNESLSISMSVEQNELTVRLNNEKSKFKNLLGDLESALESVYKKA